MASKNTQLKARNNQGNELSVSHSQTDSPILDVASLERLQQFRPDIVDFIIEQTAKEADSRIKNEAIIILFTFIERLGGILLAFAICILGVIGSVWTAKQGYTSLAITIAVTCIGTLAVAFLNKK
ncbi:MAG: hypothetical protein IJR46_05225 [Neisseriaceae bacterium]|nr:hypothetical protein [Neisseriaceae bacterium]